MNRVMMEVFPTDWSPKKTSLYLASGFTEYPSVLVVVVLSLTSSMVFVLGQAGRSAQSSSAQRRSNAKHK
jgi:hypothetical protein